MLHSECAPSTHILFCCLVTNIMLFLHYQGSAHLPNEAFSEFSLTAHTVPQLSVSSPSEKKFCPWSQPNSGSKMLALLKTWSVFLGYLKIQWFITSFTMRKLARKKCRIQNFLFIYFATYCKPAWCQFWAIDVWVNPFSFYLL